MVLRDALRFGALGLAAASGLGVAVLWDQGPAGADTNARYAEVFRKEDAGRAAKGAVSCKQCHVKQTRRDGSSRDEYTLWADAPEGGHRDGYKALETERSQRMAKLVGAVDKQGTDPTQRKDCLSCHSFGADPLFTSTVGGKKRVLRHGEFFQMPPEGVSCESCHGRAGGTPREFAANGEPESRVDQYLDEHQSSTWREKDAATWQKLGMYDTRTVESWAQKCLECHLGAPGQRISHALYAAGHPELGFELSNDVLRVPHHWRDSKMYLDPAEERWFYARLWAVGQATYLREAMAWLVEASHDARPVDYAMLDCFSCHHELRRTPSFNDGDSRQLAKLARQKLGYLGQVDEPGWHGAAWAMPRHLLKLLAPARAAEAEKLVQALFQGLSAHEADWPKVRQAASGLEAIAAELAKACEKTMLPADKTLALLHGIAADGEHLAALGFRACDQATRAVYTLWRLAYARTEPRPQEHDRVMQGIDALRESLRRGPSAFDAYEFARRLEELGARLPPKGS